MVVIAANRRRAVGIHSHHEHPCRSDASIGSFTGSGHRTLASFFVTIGAYNLLGAWSSPGPFWKGAYCKFAKRGIQHRVGVAVFVALQAGWIVALMAQIYPRLG